MDVVLVGKAGDRMRNPMLDIAKRNLAGTSYDVCSRLLVGLVANCGFAFLSCLRRQAMRWTGVCNGRRKDSQSRVLAGRVEYQTLTPP